MTQTTDWQRPAATGVPGCAGLQLAPARGAGRPGRSGNRIPNIRRGAAALVIFSTLAFLNAHAAADPYLDSINAEAKRIETIGRAKQELEQTRAKAAQAAPKPAARPENRAAATDAASLERELREYPHVLSLYELLNPAEKSQVLDDYVKARDKDALSRRVVVIQRVIHISSRK